MDKPSQDAAGNKSRLLHVFVRNYSGPITGVALSVLSAWMIVTGIKDGLGVELTARGAIADLFGIAIVVGVARWIKTRHGVK